MSVQIIGELDLPLTDPSVKTKLRFTRSITLGNVVRTARQVYTCGTDGTYNFNLALGACYVEVQYDETWEVLAHVEVDALTPSPLDLATLVNDYATLPPIDEGDNDVIADLQAQIHANDADILDLQGRTSALETSEADHTTRLNTLDTDVATIQVEQTTQNGRLDSVETKNTEQDAIINSLQGRPTFIGTYDANLNRYTDTNGVETNDLPVASTVNVGDYIIVSVGGTISSTNAPELNGQVVAAQDEFLASTTAWLYSPVPQNFISSVLDDSAAGVITFDVGAKSSKVPVDFNDVIRKQELDATDAQVALNNSNILGLQSEVLTLQTGQSTQGVQITANTDDITLIKSEQTTQNTRLDAVETVNSGQDATLTTHDTRLVSLEANDTTQDARLAALEVNSKALGMYDATLNLVSIWFDNSSPSDLPSAASVTNGDRFYVRVAGTLNAINAPELNGIVVDKDDLLIAVSGLWEVIPNSSANLSSVDADEALGHITFTGGAAFPNAPTASTDPARKQELDGKAELVHTHVEADITDLDKYSTTEVDKIESLKFYNALASVDLATLGTDARHIAVVDCYAPTENIEVKLLPKASYGNGKVITVHNQNDSPKTVTVKDDAGTILKEIPADHSYAFGFSPSQPVWTLIHTRGFNAIPLDVTVYGNMDAPERGVLQAGTYVTAGNGSEFSNLPADWQLISNVPYIILETITISGGVWKHEIEFTSAFDATNKNMGVHKSRGGGNFGGAIAGGWKPIVQPNTFGVTTSETLLLPDGVPVRLLALANAATITPVGFELDITHMAIKNISGGTMDRVDGSFPIQIFRTAGGVPITIHVFSEHSDDNGATWIFNPDSVRQFRFPVDAEGYRYIESFYNLWADGTMVRFGFMAEGGDAEIRPPVFTHPTYGAQSGKSAIWAMSQRQ